MAKCLRALRPEPADVDGFIAWESRQKRRYELIGGEIYLMAGGRVAHSRISANLIRLLGNALQGGACAPHGSDLKVRSPSGDVMYPDVLVLYGSAEDDATFIDDPVLIVEVVSPSTKRYDLSKKRYSYMAIPSLQHMMFVVPDIGVVELATRAGEGRWLSTLSRLPDGRISVETLGVELAVAEIFTGTSVARGQL